MKIHFTKMHGIGNDYIYINCMDGEPAKPDAIAVAMSPRHFSVGADGVVLICRSGVADAKMRMFNADGSEGKMCGNASRCIGKYLYDKGICRKPVITLETLSGIKTLTVHPDEKTGKVVSVTVDMGYATFAPDAIPLAEPQEYISRPISLPCGSYEITALSVGNPHAVVFSDSDPDLLDLEKIGPMFENHPLFPEKVNTEFIRVVDRRHLKMRVWERGSGETWACGTGACASVAAAVRCGCCDGGCETEVTLRGGTLKIECSPDYHLLMTGGAVTVFEGDYEYEDSCQ